MLKTFFTFFINFIKNAFSTLTSVHNVWRTNFLKLTAHSQLFSGRTTPVWEWKLCWWGLIIQLHHRLLITCLHWEPEELNCVVAFWFKLFCSFKLYLFSLIFSVWRILAKIVFVVFLLTPLLDMCCQWSWKLTICSNGICNMFRAAFILFKIMKLRISQHWNDWITGEINKSYICLQYNH